MSLKYPVAMGTVLLCNYSLGGFAPPEMVKKRPAVVISPRLPHRDGLCTLVPLSGSKPNYDLPYLKRIELESPLPDPFPQKVWWAKCDMLATVGFFRLDLFHTPRMASGQRKYLQPKVSAEQLEEIRQGVFAALGFPRLLTSGD